MGHQNTGPQDPLSRPSMQESIIAQGDNPAQDTDDEKAVYMELRESLLARINAHFFEEILPDLEDTSLRDRDCHVYRFPDRHGKPLRIDGRCQLSPDDVMQTSGFRAIQRYCDTYGWKCELTQFYQPDRAYVNNKFVLRFDGDYTSPLKSFQLKIQGHSPGNSLTESAPRERGGDPAP